MCKNMIKLVAYMIKLVEYMWEVANGKFQFSYLQAGTRKLKSVVVQ